MRISLSIKEVSKFLNEIKVIKATGIVGVIGSILSNDYNKFCGRIKGIPCIVTVTQSKKTPENKITHKE